MTDQPTPETDAKLADDPQPSSDSPDYARALEIKRNEARAERNRDMWKGQSERQAAELATLRAHHGRLAANNQELKELLVLLARAIHDENWKEIGNLVPRMNAAFATPAQ